MGLEPVGEESGPYELSEKIQNHPMNEFKEMSEVDDLEDFAEQFSILLETLSENTIIQVNDEENEINDFKQWVVDYTDGYPVCAEIGGELTVAEPHVESPSVPEDIKLNSVSDKAGVTLSDTPPENPSEGDEWLDSSFEKPEKKVYTNNGWRTMVEGSNVPKIQEYDEGTYTIDVSDIKSTVEVVVAGEPGDEAEPEKDPHTPDYDEKGAGGKGGLQVASVDLEPYNEIEVRVATHGDPSHPFNWTREDEGEGGWSSAIIADGSIIVGAGGGGGGGWYYSSDGTERNGENGGGPAGGDYGDGDWDEKINPDGGDGGGWVANNRNVESEETGTSNEASVTLFNNQ